MRRILLRGARQLLTLRGSHGPRRGPALRQLSIIENGSVLIDSGLIREIGPTRRVENLLAARNAEVIDASGMVVMPGFVDCHAHVPGIVLGGAPGTAIATIVSLAEAVRTVPTSRLHLEHREVMRRCAEHGTTTVGVLAGFGWNEAADAKALRGVLSLPVSPVRAVPSWFGLQLLDPENPDAGHEQAERASDSLLLAMLRRGPLEWVHAACGEGCFDAADCIRYVNSARTLGLRTRLDFAAFGRTSSLRELLEVEPWTFEHLEFANRDDLRALADSGTMAVLLPSMVFAQRWPNYVQGRNLIDVGVPIALGSDFRPGVVDGLSMQFVIYLACRMMNLTVEEAIVAATMNAAHALGLAHRIGSIEPGKQADLILLRTSDYRALGYEFGVNLVVMTIHSGKIVSRRTATD